MRLSTRQHIAISLPALLACMAAQASDCDTNFVASGNFITGYKFTTSAQVSDVLADPAFTAASQYLLKEGITVLQVDRSAHLLSGLLHGSTPNRPIPLNLAVEDAGHGARLTLTLTTPGGVFTNDAAAKEEFCKVVAASAMASATTPAAREPERAAGKVSEPPKTGATPEPSNRVCLGKACLGMTLQEATVLPLDEVERIFRFVPNHIQGAFGLNDKGERVWWAAVQDMDAPTIRQYSQTVKVLCKTSGFRASMKASDGQPIKLEFHAILSEGRPKIVLTYIDRKLPDTMSASEKNAFEQQAKAKYGDAYFKPDYFSGNQPKAAYVTLGRSLLFQLRSVDADSEKLMEQPGCTSRPSLE
ncbi:hypothetical protein [Duganella vulcania]|uniref:Uncharacterized protein n=1 Tax=Duganella vulcania TaxID=2692166 RepID=A0A845GFD4_9BURK|nr:hypothetical protein [Duganella vulcania]MYM92651.1 hypothetical protein [Duganella vulcania]